MPARAPLQPRGEPAPRKAGSPVPGPYLAGCRVWSGRLHLEGDKHTLTWYSEELVTGCLLLGGGHYTSKQGRGRGEAVTSGRRDTHKGVHKKHAHTPKYTHARTHTHPYTHMHTHPYTHITNSWSSLKLMSI